MTRIVLDANQLVSAVLVPAGSPARVLAAWQGVAIITPAAFIAIELADAET
jgi:predicted nucleic acid-binding protein